MPIIDVTMLEGRPTETKTALIRELTDAAERVLGVPRASIRVLIRELPADSWGVGGETKASEPKRR
jgi:4-oxalocrotonate tautomerase